jgi:hypothetical protein
LSDRLVLADVTQQTVNDSVLDGVVIDQTPKAYERVVLQSPVSITVGRLERRVYKGDVAVEIKLEADALIKVTVSMADGVEELQYCMLHPKGDSTARFLVRSDMPGAHTVKIFRENELIQTLSVTLK